MDFEAEVRKIGDAEHRQHVVNLETLGFTRVENFMSLEMCGHLLNLVRHYHAEHRGSTAEPPEEWSAGWVLNLQNKHTDFIEIQTLKFLRRIIQPRLNDPHLRNFDADQPNYILGQYMARTSQDEGLYLHIDAGMPAIGGETTMMQTAFVLEDSPPEKGCTQAVPGSHRSGRYSDRESATAIDLPANARDLQIWDGRIWHGAGANTTGDTRWQIISTAQRWWVKQSYDMPRNLPQEIYERLTADERALLGCATIPPWDEATRRTRAVSPESLPDDVAELFAA